MQAQRRCRLMMKVFARCGMCGLVLQAELSKLLFVLQGVPGAYGSSCS